MSDPVRAILAALADEPDVGKCLDAAAMAADRGYPAETITEMLTYAATVVLQERPELDVDRATLTAMLAALLSDMRGYPVDLLFLAPPTGIAN